MNNFNIHVLIHDFVIADKFAKHFANVCTNNSVSGSVRLAREYKCMRSGYAGYVLSESCMFDAELVQNVINKMKRGKAGGLDGITIEHLQFSHPLIIAMYFGQAI